MKKLTLVYAGANPSASVERAAQLRSNEWDAYSIDAIMFSGPEKCERVVIMPDMPSWRRDAIAKAYGPKVMREVEPAPGIISKADIQAEFERRDIVDVGTYNKLPTPLIKRPRGRPRKIEGNS